MQNANRWTQFVPGLLYTMNNTPKALTKRSPQLLQRGQVDNNILFVKSDDMSAFQEAMAVLSGKDPKAGMFLFVHGDTYTRHTYVLTRTHTHIVHIQSKFQKPHLKIGKTGPNSCNKKFLMHMKSRTKN